MLGDSIPVAAGIAMGAGMRGKPRVAMAWIGDGATSTGAFHEGLNFAAVQKIPLVVVAEDNKYAYSTPIAKQMAIKRIDERAASYGIPHELVDGNDMLAVYDVAKRMVDAARAGGGAQLIGVDTMRMQGHAQHDDARYVPKETLDEWAAKDPLERFKKAADRKKQRQREGPRRHRQDDEGLRGEGSGPGRRRADAGSRDASRAASMPATTTRCRRWSWCERSASGARDHLPGGDPPGAVRRDGARRAGVRHGRGRRRLRRRVQGHRGADRQVRREAGDRHADLRGGDRRLRDRRVLHGHAAGLRDPVHRLHRLLLRHAHELRRDQPLPQRRRRADRRPRAVGRRGRRRAVPFAQPGSRSSSTRPG